jgi:hypothetical protein
MSNTDDRPDLSSEGAPDIDKTVNVNRNKHPAVRPTWALKPVLTDRLVVGRNVTLTLRVTQFAARVRGWRGMVVNVQGREPGRRGTSTVRSRYRAT